MGQLDTGPVLNDRSDLNPGPTQTWKNASFPVSTMHASGHLEMVKLLLEKDDKFQLLKGNNSTNNQENEGIVELVLNYGESKKLEMNNNACDEKRVTIHMNLGEGKKNSKLIILPHSLQELLKIAGTYTFLEFY